MGDSGGAAKRGAAGALALPGTTDAESRPSMDLPLPPGTGWTPMPRTTGLGGWDQRRTYPSGYTSPLREKYTKGPVYTQGTILGPIVGHERVATSMTFVAYRIAKNEPTEIVMHCCPDGGTDLFLAAARKDRTNPVLLVSWGVAESEPQRRAMLTEWARNVEDYLDAR